ncbi:hypothetical protein [Pseudomonas coleopterorum]|uniref:hypothetical protein n=1 Tax=Pseudomonas coleopterorum TaxID=1605838 RepID=UPI00089B1697|nr:hypothetical protein [Pseudomonas coleopterorum]SEE39431.1 hypothetical protein SAMN05216510_2449 [Pseudomonas coleopterorum]
MADFSEKMREEFEAWYLASMVELLGKGVRDQAQKNLAWTRDDGTYADPALRLGLMAWQASRAAVMVQMPQQSGVNLDWNQAIRYCIQAVEAEGLGWKP